MLLVQGNRAPMKSTDFSYELPDSQNQDDQSPRSFIHSTWIECLIKPRTEDLSAGD